MSQSINLSYKFLSTGTFDPRKTDSDKREQEMTPAQRIISIIIGRLRHIQNSIHSVNGVVLDFRLINVPNEKSFGTLKCFITFSFKMQNNDRIEKTKIDLKNYCESLLTFTFRQENFTIEFCEGEENNFDSIKNVVEVLRHIDMQGKKTKLIPKTFNLPLNVAKLANVMLRTNSTIGFSVMLNIHGWSESEKELIFQGGIQSPDPFLGSVFAPPPLEDGEENYVDKPICKMKFYSETDFSPYLITELLECISSDTLTTHSVKKGSTDFANEMNEIKDYEVDGSSKIDNQFIKEPLLLKVYRSISINEIMNVSPIPRGLIPGIKHKKYNTYYPSITEISPSGLKIGTVRTEAMIDPVDVNISEKDRLRHLYVIGKTGTGKSSLLSSMILQDILENKSAIVIDPHGDLCDDIISCVPEKCLDNIVLIDPMLSEDYPNCSLNVLKLQISKDTNTKEFYRLKSYWTNELTSMFLALYGAEIFGPRIQEYFRAACLTLMEPEINGSLEDVTRLFTDEEFLTQCREKLTDENTKKFWTTYDKIGYKEKEEMVPYFSSKFAPLVSDYLIKFFIAPSSSFLDFEKYIRDGKTVLIKLSKGQLGELGMRLIGMLLMSRIKSLIFSREKIEPKERIPFSLHVDEFQNFVSQDFESLLSESRKYGCGLVLAHQYLGQMQQGSFVLYGSGNNNSGILDAIFGNIGSFIIFRIGVKDSKEFQPLLGEPIKDNDLTNLSNYEFIARVLNNGTLSSPMTINAYRDELLNYPTNRNELKERIIYLMKSHFR
jgi:hypothetical protein